MQKRNPKSNRIDRALLPLMGMNIQGDVAGVTCYTNRKRKLVVFAKSPPKEPASYLQTRQRNHIRRAAALWSATPKAIKQLWNLVATRAHLRIPGYHLFCYFQLTHDRAAILTLMHQTRVHLPV